MKSIFFTCLCGVILVFATFCLGVAVFGADATPAADTQDLSTALGTLLDNLTPYLPESWNGWLTTIVSVCAVLAAVIPRPKEGANVVWRMAYNLVNALGFNVARAKNASAVANVAGALGQTIGQTIGQTTSKEPRK